MKGGVSTRGTGERTGAARLYKPGTAKGVLIFYGHGSQDSWYNLDDAFGDGEVIHTARPSASLDDSAPCRWGNAAMRTAISTLRTNAQVSLFASGKVHLLGISAGATAAFNWAKANPSLVQSILGVVPAIDIQDIHTNNRGGFAAEIATAYGGAPADADNPADNAATFASIPHKLLYATDDPICTAAAVTAFAAASGAKLHSLGAIGHTVPAGALGALASEFFRGT